MFFVYLNWQRYYRLTAVLSPKHPQKMKNSWLSLLMIAALPACSSLKTAKTAANYDDAYFATADIDQPGVYSVKKADMTASATPTNVRETRSYGQSYSDRFRNFGSTSM